jgi:hypothetical protein
MPDPVWYHLRLSRSNPPGLAATDEFRRETYNAALNQFEELFEAATRVSAASRPLPIFYALAQAGRAIVAAHGATLPPKSHGLTLAEPAVALMDTRVKRTRDDGWFQGVSAVLNSPDVGQLPLAQVWAAIPDLAFTPLPTQPWPTALMTVAGPLLGRFALYSSRSVRVAVLFNETVDVPSARTLLANYPAARNAAVAHNPGAETTALTYDTPNGKGTLVDFSVPPDQPDMTQDEILARYLPEYRFRGDRWLLPTLTDGQDLHPLMTWWLLLFALSMLARYHPAAWTRALDVDRSPMAVPLEDALEEALRAVPQLIVTALLKEPILLQRQ